MKRIIYKLLNLLLYNIVITKKGEQVIITYSSEELNNRYNLCKEAKINKIKLKDNLFNTKKYIEISDNIDPEIYLNILYFTINLYQKIDNNILNNLENNIKNVKVNVINDYDDTFYPYYVPDTNVIYIPDNNINSIFHELVHVSSTYIDYEKNEIYSGFSITDINTHESIADHINEGYTQLKNRELFKYVLPYYNNTYPIEIKLAKKLENILGKTTLDKLYFTGNLDGLKKLLIKYIGLEDTNRFIEYTDKLEIYNDIIYEDIDINSFSNEYINGFKDTIYQIYLILIKLYINKSIYNKNISNYNQLQLNILKNNLHIKINHLIKLKYGNIIDTYDIFNKEDIKESIDECINQKIRR